ncbi:hypothetical protein K504DRAFT_500673 [Pleomassaria siparia CBS 279.74]|uniref:SMP domain-containing protein n=1 Tax=Pleomassaria siparia CBS 279.74 TaxID=1314801 RepID=A0A6G1KD05_9PLEO|nr:hypothetical protein K504DRAFT_500673 [Pleomassaria siparia CBS 279.74]
MSNPNPSKTQMTKEDAGRIQSSQAKGGKDTGKGSFAAIAQSAGDKNAKGAGAGAGASANAEKK